jgi:hypothetical protein
MGRERLRFIPADSCAFISPFLSEIQPIPSPPSSSPKTSGQTGKRAEQNRLAQKAFRERKERYMNALEMRVRELEQKTLHLIEIQQELLIAKQLNHQLQLENQRLLTTLGQSNHLQHQERAESKEKFEAFSVSCSTLNWHFYQEEGESMLPFFASEDESSLYSNPSSLALPLPPASAPSNATCSSSITITTVPY